MIFFINLHLQHSALLDSPDELKKKKRKETPYVSLSFPRVQVPSPPFRPVVSRETTGLPAGAQVQKPTTKQRDPLSRRRKTKFKPEINRVVVSLANNAGGISTAEHH